MLYAKNKKYLIISSILLIGIQGFGQRNKKPQNLPRYDFQKIHFGFTLGINELNFNLQKNANTITNDTLKTIHQKAKKDLI